MGVGLEDQFDVAGPGLYIESEHAESLVDEWFFHDSIDFTADKETFAISRILIIGVVNIKDSPDLTDLFFGPEIEILLLALTNCEGKCLGGYKI